MRNIAEFFYQINRLGFSVWLENSKLKYRQYKECANKTEIINKIKDNKNNIINFLKTNNYSSCDLINPQHIYRSDNNKEVLSFAQERLWFIEKYVKGTNAYNIPLVYKLSNNIKLNFLENSIRDIISRHEILRTLIKEDDEGNGYQLVLDDKDVQLEISKIIVADQLKLDLEISKAVNYIYDLNNECPIRVNFYEIKTEEKKNIEYYLSIVVHHIAFDGWSLEIFLKELHAYYNYYLRLSQGLDYTLNLPILNIQYKDFSLWQRNYLSKEWLNNQLDYWKNNLTDYETLNLVTDKPRPNQIDYKGADVYFALDESTSISLRELAKELDVSLFSIALSAYYLMLKAYSNQNDLVIGIPVANRHYTQVENIIGFFVNAIALRIKIDSKTLIKDFIRCVNQEVIEAQIHQDLPFEKLVEELKISQDTSRHPIFQVMFGVQRFGSELLNQNEPPGIENKSEDILQTYTNWTSLYKIAKFDISTFIDDSHTILRGSFNYATSLYSEETINGFIDTYIQILKEFAGLVKNKEEQDSIKISNLRYLNEEQEKLILYKWNAVDKEYPSNKTIQKLFEEQVERSPDSIAVIYEKKKLTYKQLNERANQLACYLRQNYTIVPDTLIALCLDRSEHMLIAILAILKAGGAYVPIDPDYPKERIGYILEDTNTVLVMTNTVHKDKLEDLNQTNKSTKILAIDSKEIQTELSLQLIDNQKTETTSTNLAYVIYTSGTTGYPKGVMIEHKSLSAVIDSVKYLYFNVKQSISTYSVTEYVFDIFGLEYCLPLSSGGTLYVGTNEFNLLDCTGYDFFQMTPTLCKLKLDLLVNASATKLFIGGEILDSDLLEKILNKGIDVINFYGPTETTIWSTSKFYSCKNTKPVTITIGRPFFGEYAYVLDNCLNPVPIGAIGELYLGGIGLARGYLNRVDLTAELFISNPFQTIEEKRSGKNGKLYKTGDLVRWTLDGNLEYIGRNDFQVKIRGFRIELGEIESVISSYPGVKQSVVLAKEHEGTNRELTSTIHLVGYYVSEVKLDDESILNYLRGRLPEYMVPNVLVHLDNLPLTINGKLARGNLPNPNFRENEGKYIASRNELENKICSIWGEVLGIEAEKIGIHDNFFKMGGNSILAIRLITKLNNYYQSHLKVSDIFVHKNIESLSNKIIQTKPGYQAIVKLNNTYEKPNMFMVHPAEEGCQCYAALADAQINDFSCYGIDSYNLYNETKIGSLHDLAKYYLSHIDEVMKKTHQDTYHLLGWCLGGLISLEIASILEQRGNTKINVYLLDTTLQDNYLTKCLTEISGTELDEIKKQYRNNLISNQYEESYIEKMMSMLDVEVNLTTQQISSRLTKTMILLFKAMSEGTTIKNEHAKIWFDYVSNLKYNNIDKIVEQESNIQVIRVDSADHGNILDHEQLLVTKIIEFKKQCKTSAKNRVSSGKVRKIMDTTNENC